MLHYLLTNANVEIKVLFGLSFAHISTLITQISSLKLISQYIIALNKTSNLL